MRIKSIFISKYKNLENFSFDFSSQNIVDLFVGKNGSGKSNLFEAITLIFRHLDNAGRQSNEISFEYEVSYEIENETIEIEWKSNRLRINQEENRKSLGKTPFPDNIIIYYSGHNTAVSKIVSDYEDSFRNRIKNSSLDETRRFMGIGLEYKELLLSFLLILPRTSKANQIIREKLGISALGIKIPGTTEITEPILKISLQRPIYAKRSAHNSYNIDPYQPDSAYWHLTGSTRESLDELVRCTWSNSDKLTIPEGYFANIDEYALNLSVSKIQESFSTKLPELFRLLDNLKLLGMIRSVSVPLFLKSGLEADLTHFSDGQFQTIYIYSIVEILKSSNCLILLDEPDSFLHPEWQFQFLDQIFGIASETPARSHVLMSSHSASTISRASEPKSIHLLQECKESISVSEADRSEVIKTLSSGFIAFSESEARLSINQILEESDGNVLFTEGITDELILITAWSKLFGDAPRPFCIQNAFDRIFLRNLFSRDELKQNFPGRLMFALFDFDEAYDDWNGLKSLAQEIVDPYCGLTKQLQHPEHYALLLPVPKIDSIKRQVLNEKNQPWGKGQDSHLSIELLFFKEEWVGKWFNKRSASGGAEIIEFSGNKAVFAKTVIPSFESGQFEIFRPLFEFIISKCHHPKARASQAN